MVEREAADKNEFYGGEIFAMAGAQEHHNIIVMNIGAMLLSALAKVAVNPSAAI